MSSTPRSYEELSHAYREASGRLSERQKADLEELIFQAATIERVRPPGEDRGTFFFEKLGIPKYESSNRAGLRGRGAKADPLWSRIEKDSMPVRSAVELIRKAETMAYSNREDFLTALTRVLEEYDSKPLAALPNGKFIKKRGGRRLKDDFEAAQEPAPPTVTSESPIAVISAKSSRDTWRVIRQLTEAMLKERMAGCDPVFIETMSRDFSVDLSALIESYQGRINRMGSTLRGESLIPAGKEKETVNDACRTLNLDEIERVGDILDIIRARKNAKAFLAKFHPDKNPGENQKLFERKYQSVVNALGVIEEYNNKHGVQNVGSNV